VQHHSGADAEVVLVVVGAIVEGGDEVVGFNDADGDALAGTGSKDGVSTGLHGLHRLR
jgi:hypothetical protein